TEGWAARDWLGPRLGCRPWRWFAGLMLGLAIGTKWSGLYFLAVFGLLTVLWDVGARRAVGLRKPRYAAARRDGIPAFFTIVPLAAVTYLGSWWGWFVSEHGYNKGWAAGHPVTSTWAWVPDDLRSWWDYQGQILDFHRGLATPHSYQSHPWSWIVMGRPTSMFAEYPKLGEDGCTVDMCAKAITPIGTPTIWWVGVGAVLLLLFRWALGRDWRAGAILAGYAGGYLPWFVVGDRTIYQFYAVAFVPYVVLAVTYLIGVVLGPPGCSRERRQVGAAAVGCFLVLTALVFAWFLPLYTAQVIPYRQWWLHMWFPSWV
ncbi:MAG: phospholipid carrier-dependent glycosyltransferase, partial [Candidatus Phosphoribacter sp.]